MTQPDFKDQIAGLLQLSGSEKTDVQGTALAREMLLVKLIADAMGNGATWAQVGLVLTGTSNGKLAKKIARRLARDAQRDLLKKGDINGE